MIICILEPLIKIYGCEVITKCCKYNLKQGTIFRFHILIAQKL